MQKLDRATLLELEWRDFFFWPLARFFGFLYGFISNPLSRMLSFFLRFILSPFGRHRFNSHFFEADILEKEILTLANFVTFFGLFLWGELVYLIWAWFAGSEHIRIFAVSSLFFDMTKPTVFAMAILTMEIFLGDLADGPLARVNDAVTALGTIMDHTRDYLTAFTALFFLLAVTYAAHDTALLILECAVVGSFVLVMAYHAKLMRLYAHSRKAGGRTPIGKILMGKLEMIREFALEEYQTKLTGRIQFGAMAVSIGLGLLHYAIENQIILVLFTIALVCAVMATSYYLYELWGEYYEKWQTIMQEKSQELKEKLVDKIQREMK